MKKSILFKLCFSLAIATALLSAGCADKGTEAGGERWEGDVDDFLQACCGGVGATHEYGTLADGRDGKTYKTIAIDGITWMAENLNYRTADGSWCYDNNVSNCVTYGRLYNWDAAAEACPTGWHLSTEKEWNALIETAGGTGKRLKSSSGWSLGSLNNTDFYGFSALPGGLYNPSVAGSVYSSYAFNSSGSWGYWWADEGICVRIDYDNEISTYSSYVYHGYSVRCVKN